jgi:photosystem II stability/assembly factor-like uncharacterized protein
VSETDLESIYSQAHQAIKAKENDRATDLLKQILVIDENYKDASRLLARLVKEKRRRWYNDNRVWGTVFGLLIIGMLVWFVPKLPLQTMYKSPTMTVTPVSPTVTTLPTKTISPSITPTVIPSLTPVPLIWKRISIGQELTRDMISVIIIDPGDPEVIYVGTENAGIYKSIDGGVSWRSINKGLKQASIVSIVIDPIDTKILYASVSPQSDIYKTIDGGENWQTADEGIRDENSTYNLLVIDPTNNEHLFFSTQNNLYASINQGGYWTLIKSDQLCPKDIYSSKSLLVDSRNSETLYAITFGSSSVCTAGLYKSIDGGKTWTITGLQAELLDFIVVEHNSQGGDFLFVNQKGVGDFPHFHTSSDGGKTWQHSKQKCAVVTIHPQGGTLGYCDGALLKTMDGGQTWKTISTPGINQITTMAISPSDPSIIIIGGEGLHISRDGGTTWQELRNGLPAGRFEIRVNPRDNSRIYAFPWHVWNQYIITPLYRLRENDQNLELLGKNGHGLLFDADGKTLYRYGESLLRSIDNGSTWVTLSLPYSDNSQRGWDRVFTNPIKIGELYHVQTEGNISFSTNGGTNWEELSSLKTNGNLQRANLSFDSEGTPLYLVLTNQTLRSPDAGRTWNQCADDFTSTSLSDTRLVIDPRNSNHLLVAKFGAGVIGSSDGCATWQSRNTGLDNLNITPLVNDPNNPDTVYIGTDSGAFVSYNFGHTWGRINDGLVGATVIYSLHVDNDGNVYAATPYGIFKLESK